jgi:type VI secretion system protein ImpC
MLGTTVMEAVPMPDPSDDLLDRMLAQSPEAVDAEKERAGRAINAAIRHGLAELPGMVIPGDAEGTIRRWQAEIDAKLTAQLRAIMHHPAFRRLEATWRGLNYLVQRAETAEGLKVKVLNTGKAELAQSTAAAVRTQLDRGEPIRVLVADFEFGDRSEDMAVLSAVGAVAEAVRAPLLAAATPGLFGLTDYAQLSRADSEEMLRQFDDTWAEFHNSPAGAAVSLTLPRVLARVPYGADTEPVETFEFEEVSGPSPDQYVWMSAAWVYAERVTAAAVRGGAWDGRAEGLPLNTFVDADGERVARSTEALVPDSWAYELSARGFAVLVQSASAYEATFVGGPGVAES